MSRIGREACWCCDALLDENDVCANCDLPGILDHDCIRRDAVVDIDEMEDD